MLQETNLRAGSYLCVVESLCLKADFPPVPVLHDAGDRISEVLHDREYLIAVCRRESRTPPY